MLFSLLADSAAIGTTLTGIRSRNYTAPADKYSDQMKSALPPHLLPMLEWELADDTDADGLVGVVAGAHGAAARSARL